MDTKNDTVDDIRELQEQVVHMRVLYTDEITKKQKKINKIKMDILQKANYTTEYEPIDIPSFPFEKYEQLPDKESELQKTRNQLKEEIIILRTLLQKRTCPIEKLLRE